MNHISSATTEEQNLNVKEKNAKQSVIPHISVLHIPRKKFFSLRSPTSVSLTACHAICSQPRTTAHYHNAHAAATKSSNIQAAHFASVAIFASRSRRFSAHRSLRPITIGLASLFASNSHVRPACDRALSLLAPQTKTSRSVCPHISPAAQRRQSSLSTLTSAPAHPAMGFRTSDQTPLMSHRSAQYIRCRHHEQEHTLQSNRTSRSPTPRAGLLPAKKFQLLSFKRELFCKNFGSFFWV